MWLLLPLLLALWGLLASPVIAATVWWLRRLRRRGDRRAFWPPLLAAVFSALAAPMPTPIITVLVPHALLLMQGRYYPELDGHPAMQAQMWPWVRGSLLLTWLVAWLWIHWRLRAPSRTPLADAESG